ncbi:MAG TPA: hypothetical protein VGC67_10705 [Cellulomonas sp.]
MRFNPPPSWPTPPEGWTPPPGWQPDASLPPVPEGWPLWVPDDAPAAPAAPGWGGAVTPGLVPTSASGHIGPLPPVAPAPASPFATGGFTPAPIGYPAPGAAAAGAPGGAAGQGPMPTWSAPPAAPEAGRAERRSATLLFWIGVVVFTIGGVSLILASGDGGGFIWTGGLLVGTVMLIRSLLGYRGARKAGAPSFATRGWLGMAGGLVVCAAVAAVAAVAFLVPGSVTPHATTGVGSCWALSGSTMLEAVDCGSDHDYTGVQVVSSLDGCPLDATMYVTADEGGYLCLTADS